MPNAAEASNVWKLESPEEEVWSDELSLVCDEAIGGDEEARSVLRGIWDNESWESIEEKLKTEGSVWYVWWMDGVRELMTMDKRIKEAKDAYNNGSDQSNDT